MYCSVHQTTYRWHDVRKKWETIQTTALTKETKLMQNPEMDLKKLSKVDLKVLKMVGTKVGNYLENSTLVKEVSIF